MEVRKYLERIGKAYFGESDWEGKASEKVRSHIQGVSDLRGMEIAVKEIEEKMRLDIQVNVALKMTPDEVQNLFLTATESSPSGPTDKLFDISGKPLLDIYQVLCTPAAF